MDPASLAAAALAAAVPYLLGLGKVAADEGAKAAGKTVFDWIKGKLTSASGKEAVEGLEKAPDKERNQLKLKIALEETLEADPEAAVALAKLLPAGAVSGVQTLNQSGSGNTGVLADRGSHVTIQR
jgi:hypothetical protein